MTHLYKKNYTEFRLEKLRSNKPSDKYFIFTLLLILFHIGSNVVWINLNNVSPTWDAAYHTVLSLKFLDYIRESFFHFKIVDFLRISDYYPPFVHLIGSVLAFLGKRNHKVIQLTGTIFFSFSILFLYLLIAELLQNKRTAFFSSFIYSFFITIYQQSRSHMLDLPLTAAIVCGLYYLYKSENFKNKQNTLIFFVVLAISFLIKWYSLVYFFIPVLISVLKIINNKQINGKLLKNIFFGVLIFLIISIPWYWINLISLNNAALITITGEKADPQVLFSFNNLFFYLKLIIMFQMTFVGFIFFVISFFLFIKEAKSKETLWLILGTVLFIYLFFTIIGNKNIRYLIPLMPFFAIIIAFGLNKLLITGRNLAVAGVSFLICYLIFTFFILSFGIPIFPRYKYALNFPLIGWVDVYYWHYYPVRVIYQNNKISYEEILKDILGLQAGRINVLLLKNTEEINSGILDPYLYSVFAERKNDITFMDLSNLKSNMNTSEIQYWLNSNVDIVVVAKNYLGLPDAIREYENLHKFQQFFLLGEVRSFTFIKEYHLAGNEFYREDTLLLYKKDL